MNETYVTYSQAVKLKELGFDWYVRGYYTRDNNFREVRKVTALNHNDTKKFKNILSAPRIDQAAKWLLKKKGYYIEVPFSAGNGVDQTDGWLYRIVNVISYEGIDCYITYASPEDALSAGISKALELLGKEDKE